MCRAPRVVLSSTSVTVHDSRAGGPWVLGQLSHPLAPPLARASSPLVITTQLLQSPSARTDANQSKFSIPQSIGCFNGELSFKNVVYRVYDKDFEDVHTRTKILEAMKRLYCLDYHYNLV